MPDLMTKTDDGLTLYVPVVVSIKDGNTIDGHVGTVDGHDAHERVMTEEEVEKLTAIYSEMLEAFLE